MRRRSSGRSHGRGEARGSRVSPVPSIFSPRRLGNCESEAERKHAAGKFVEYWTFQRGSEKGEDQQFWNSLLGEVMGVADVKSRIRYQVPIQLKDTTKFLDAWIPETRVLIEHKSRGVNLGAPQSGHGGLTPYEQAVEYDNARPFDEAARKLADTPTLFRDTRNPETAIVIPEVSSESRRYIPMDFINDSVICTNKIQMIPDATIYHFGILTSSVHMAWTRAVCGRMKSDYSYSKDIVYNNFVWPDSALSPALREKISQTAQAILDVRKSFMDADERCSLAALYDATAMPPELLKAHQANDRAVLVAYGLAADTPEPEIVAHLFKLYAELTRNSR